ncbi:MAG: hypothetical protein LLG00_05705 [Planctomycetaceae bacterium]|nr:hypothetical protein [Planctomycetaceae bacterium]
MERIEIGYRELQGVDPAHVDKLVAMEEPLRQALRNLGHAAPVQWSFFDDGNHNYLFILVDAADPSYRIAQVSPLDLTLEPQQFEELVTTGIRPCAIAG